jgi:hypothetical protein
MRYMPEAINLCSFDNMVKEQQQKNDCISEKKLKADG